MVENLLSRLKGVKKNGTDKYLACCPSHPDKSPSLAIKEINDRILVHCFAGCSADSITAAVGLTQNDLFREDLSKDENDKLKFKYSQATIQHEKNILLFAKNERDNGNKLNASDLKRELQAFMFVKSCGGNYGL